MEETTLCSIQESTLWSHIAKLFGYGDCLSPDFENDPFADGYVESSLNICTFIHFGFLDRLRILFSGNIVVKTATKTDQIITSSYSKSNSSVLPLGYIP